MILALDPATKTGWAYGPAAGPVVCGSFAQPKTGNDYGRWGHSYVTWLTGWTKLADEIVYESPVTHGPGGSARRRLLSLGVLIEMHAMAAQCAVFEISNQTCKKRLYGKGGAKPADPVRRAKAWGFAPADHDEADACAVFFAHVLTRHPRAATAWADRKSAIAQASGESLL